MVLAEYPYAVFFATLLLIIICGLFSFVPQLNAPEIPDFSTPVLVRLHLVQLVFDKVCEKAQNESFVVLVIFLATFTQVTLDLLT